MHATGRVGTSTQPYATREEAAAQFAAHVNRGKVRALEALGVEIVVGEREGAPLSRCLQRSLVLELPLQRRRVQPRASPSRRDRGGSRGSRPSRRRQPPPASAAGAPASPNSSPRAPGNRLSYAVFTPSGTESVDLGLRLARAVTRPAEDRLDPRRLPRPQRVRPRRQRPPLVRSVRVCPRRIRARSLQRSRGDASGDRLRYGRGDPRIDSRRRSAFPLLAPGYLAGSREARPIRRRPAGPRRGADRTRPHGHELVLPAAGHRAGHDDHRQGPGGRRSIRSAHSCFASELEEFFDAHPFAYVSTFGGAEIGCVAASAVIEEVSSARLSRARPKDGRAVRARLRRTSIRAAPIWNDDGPSGSPTSRAGVLAAKKLIDAGVFAVFAEHDHSVTQFKPPLILDEDEVDEIAAGGRRRARMSLCARAGLPGGELRELDELVEHALSRGDESRLPTLGFGEISLVLGWPADRAEASPASGFRCSPLGLSSMPTASTLVDYIEALRRAGIRVVETEMRGGGSSGRQHRRLRGSAHAPRRDACSRGPPQQRPGPRPPARRGGGGQGGRRGRAEGRHRCPARELDLGPRGC